MTHERIANVEGGEHGQDWLDDAGSVIPEPLAGIPVGDYDPFDIDYIPEVS